MLARVDRRRPVTCAGWGVLFTAVAHFLLAAGAVRAEAPDRLDPSAMTCGLFTGQGLGSTLEAWADNEWRLLCRDRCWRPKAALAWSGSERTYLNGTEDKPLESDRPDFTEASSTVGYRRVQIETGYTYIQDNDTVDRSAHSFPEMLARIGMFAEWFEMRLAWNYGVNLTRDNVVSSIFDGGEDLYVGAKIAVTEQDGWRPEMAIMPQMNVPTGHVDLSSGEVEPGVNWLYGWDIFESVGAGGSTQVNRAQDDTGRFFAEFAQSFTINYALGDRLGAYTEWFAFFPYDAATALPQQYFDGGFTFRQNNNLQFDIRAGVGLNEAADDFFAGLGSVIRL